MKHFPYDRVGKNIKGRKERMGEDIIFVLNERIAQGCECLYMVERKPPCVLCKAEKFVEWFKKGGAQ